MAIKVGKPAIWRTKETDIPVIVEAEAGKHNGEMYYLVKGTSSEVSGVTGVPESELHQKTKLTLDEMIKRLQEAIWSL